MKLISKPVNAKPELDMLGKCTLVCVCVLYELRTVTRSLKVCDDRHSCVHMYISKDLGPLTYLVT